MRKQYHVPPPEIVDVRQRFLFAALAMRAGLR
jgi:hypothetical protein